MTYAPDIKKNETLHQPVLYPPVSRSGNTSKFMCLRVIIDNMHSSFADWKKKREERGGTKDGRLGATSSTSRVRTTDAREVGIGNEIQSFGQMVRLSGTIPGRPASAVGSVRSYRSVMTVEEQVTAVERQVEEVKEEVQSIKTALEENTKLLKLLLEAKDKK